MKKSFRYSIIIFLIWTLPPIILAALVTLVNNLLINPSFIINLIIPALGFSVVAFFINKINKPKIRMGAYYALIGALIWASPAIYFLPGADYYASLSRISQLLVILIPSVILSGLFFIIGLQKGEPAKDLSDLYVKKNLYAINSRR